MIRGLRFRSETFFARFDARATERSRECHARRAFAPNGMFIAKSRSRMGLRRDRQTLGNAASRRHDERRNGAQNGQSIPRRADEASAHLPGHVGLARGPAPTVNDNNGRRAHQKPQAADDRQGASRAT
ncbi:hypothetical protein C2L66_03110 [Paraburkholderia caribensis]|nr:hypothetical protein C2L66_03110 [Paraburkholderia caribensis]